MAFWRKTVKAGNTAEVKEGYSSARILKKGRQPAKKTRPTSVEQEKINRQRQLEKIRLQINANFGKGDWHIILHYNPDKKPRIREEAEKKLHKFERKMREAYKKAGGELKRISVTEVGKRGGLHHHMVINGGVIPAEAINDLWPEGNVNFIPLNDSGDYKELAEYLIKKTDWEYEHVEERKGKRRYSPSKNLITPEFTRSRVKRKTIDLNPRPWPGYYIDKKSVYVGVDAYTGGEYIYYRMIKLKPDFEYRNHYKHKKRRC